MIRISTIDDSQFVIALARSFDRFGPYTPVFQSMVNGNREALIPYGIRGLVPIFIHENIHQQKTAFIAVEWLLHSGHIHGIVVSEDFQRTRIAFELLKYIESLAIQRDLSHLECITAETDNVPALTCFRNFGFKDSGFPGSYPNGQRAIRLCYNLRKTNDVETV